MPVVAIKLGGSLLDLPDLADRLGSYVMSLAKSDQPLLVVGGGRLADVVRDWDHVHHLGDETAHDLAMRTLAVNETLVAGLVSRAVRVVDRDQAAIAWRGNRLPILDTVAYVGAEERVNPSVAPLPHDWSVTSDSLAAWVAATWPAARLVLLKSVDLPANVAMEDWSSRGLVDAYFARVGSLVPQVDWVNLRGDFSDLTRRVSAPTAIRLEQTSL